VTVEKRMLVDVTSEQVPSPDDAVALAWPGEIQLNQKTDIGHILHHTGTDEPSGTWTGGACPRHRRPLGSDVDLTDLGEMHRQSSGLADLTWYPEAAAADVYRLLLREWSEDGARRPDNAHPFEWWEDRVAAMWSYIWAANCRYVSEILEGPIRGRSGDGLLVASFEHNSSAHGRERPHVHNLVAMRQASAR
jgi:hypothetical protein